MAFLIDAETVLSGIEQWLELEQKWGTPIDLDDSTLEDYREEDYAGKVKTITSPLDVKRSTFNSSFVFKEGSRNSSKKSVNYASFLSDLKSPRRKSPFFYISGEILSATSVEEIRGRIDDVFESVPRLAPTSTLRFRRASRRPHVDDIIQCSISTGDLSFDDTVNNGDMIDVKQDAIDVEDEILFVSLDNVTLV